MPTWTTRLCRRATSTIHRPSRGNRVSGFSTYTSLPAAQAIMVIRACQWSGVETTTASTSRSSSRARKSAYPRAEPPASATASSRRPPWTSAMATILGVGLIPEVEDVPLADQAEADEAQADPVVRPQDPPVRRGREGRGGSATEQRSPAQNAPGVGGVGHYGGPSRDDRPGPNCCS